MDYNKLVAVTGLPGLYELISSKNDGAVIRSLEDNSTKFAASRIHNFSHLESIEVYTTSDNVNLAEIFLAMQKAGDSLPDSKDNAAVRKYFEKVYGDIDFERVYPSDLKKMVKWYDILAKNNIEVKVPELVAEEEPQMPYVKEKEEPKEEKPKKKEAPKAKAEEAPAKEAPKKAAAKKKEEPKEEKPKKKETKAKAEEKPAKKTAAKKKEEPKEKSKKKPPAKKK